MKNKILLFLCAALLAATSIPHAKTSASVGDKNPTKVYYRCFDLIRPADQEGFKRCTWIQFYVPFAIPKSLQLDLPVSVQKDNDKDHQPKLSSQRSFLNSLKDAGLADSLMGVYDFEINIDTDTDNMTDERVKRYGIPEHQAENFANTVAKNLSKLFPGKIFYAEKLPQMNCPQSSAVCDSERWELQFKVEMPHSVDNQIYSELRKFNSKELTVSGFSWDTAQSTFIQISPFANPQGVADLVESKFQYLSKLEKEWEPYLNEDLSGIKSAHRALNFLQDGTYVLTFNYNSDTKKVLKTDLYKLDEVPEGFGSLYSHVRDEFKIQGPNSDVVRLAASDAYYTNPMWGFVKDQNWNAPVKTYRYFVKITCGKVTKFSIS